MDALMIIWFTCRTQKAFVWRTSKDTGNNLATNNQAKQYLIFLQTLTYRISGRVWICFCPDNLSSDQETAEVSKTNSLSRS